MTGFVHNSTTSFEAVYNYKIDTTNNRTIAKSILAGLWGVPKDFNIYNWFEQLFIVRLLKNILKLGTEYIWKLIEMELLDYLMYLEDSDASTIKQFFVKAGIMLTKFIRTIGEMITSPIKSIKNAYESGNQLVQFLLGGGEFRDQFEAVLGIATGIFLSFLSLLGTLLLINAMMIFLLPQLIILATAVLGKPLATELGNGLITLSQLPFFKQVGIILSNIILKTSGYFSVISPEIQVYAPIVASSTSFLLIVGGTAKKSLKYVFGLITKDAEKNKNEEHVPSSRPAPSSRTTRNEEPAPTSRPSPAFQRRRSDSIPLAQSVPIDNSTSPIPPLIRGAPGVSQQPRQRRSSEATLVNVSIFPSTGVTPESGNRDERSLGLTLTVPPRSGRP